MMTESLESESLASYRLLPPIIKFEKDRRFIAELYNFIEDEKEQLQDPQPEQTYLVYRSAFDKIIDYVTAYKPLLTSIKREYEDVIDSVKTGHKEAFYLRGKIQALASQPITIANYRRRCEDLEAEIRTLQAVSKRREASIQSINAKIKEKEELAKEMKNPIPKTTRRDHRLLPGFSLAEMTDLPTLNNILIDLDSQIRDLNLSAKTKFVPRENQERLKVLLLEKLDRREMSQESSKVVQEKTAMLNVAVEAARAFNKIMPFHQNIAEAVMKSLKRHLRSASRNLTILEELSITGTSVVDEEDPSREQESEVIFEYLEKFNELIEEGRLEEAARHASNSPRGILRTMDVFLRFEQLEKETPRPGLLLFFCEALLAVVPAVRMKPTPELSFKCVECALASERHDLVQHWICSNRVTFSELLGDLLSSEAASCPTERLRTRIHDLCALVYDQTGSVAKALRCHVEARRIETALEYAKYKSQFGTSGYLELLSSHPQFQLALGLVRHELAPLNEVCATLTAAARFEDLALLLNQIIEDEVSANPAKAVARIINTTMDEAALQPEVWQQMTDSCPKHLPYLFDMCAAALVSDILASSLSIVTQDE